MRRIHLAAVVIAVAAAPTACTGPDSDDEAQVSEQIASLDPAPQARNAGEVRADRDADAVRAALWRLDPCALLEPGPGRPGSVDQTDPHGCSLDFDYETVTVQIGRQFEPGERYGLEPTDIGGAKAYVLPGAKAANAFGCRAWLPVSFSYAIEFTDWTAKCGRVRGIVERAVDRIDGPTSRQRVPGLGADDVCTLLEAGLGDAMNGRHLAYGTSDNSSGIDNCVAADEAIPASTIDDGLEPPFALLTAHGSGGDLAEAAEMASAGRKDLGTIAGRRIFGTRGGYTADCTLRWVEDTTVLELGATGCEPARRFAKRVIERIDSPSPPVSPQSPILYAAEQPDNVRIGACVDYMPLWFAREYTKDSDLFPGPACHPYAEPDVPDGAAEKVVAAEADPNVTCAITTDAVRGAFGERLRPATLDAYVPPMWTLNPVKHDEMAPPMRVRPCVFVDPERRIQVQVFVSSDPMALDPLTRDALANTDPPPRVPTGNAALGAGAGYMIGLGSEPDDPGYVAVLAGQRPPTTGTAAQPGALSDISESVADAIVDEHLS